MCLHGVITNSSESVDNILSHYHELWRIKESFRIQRHDLKVRPVFHWNESCVRAHLAICFMAFCCVRHLEYRVRMQYQPPSQKVIRRKLSAVVCAGQLVSAHTHKRVLCMRCLQR